MREIKFRVRDIINKKMGIVESLHIYPKSDDNLSILEVFIEGKKHSWYIGGEFEEFKLIQYTGLKDKNGKEIYEGDVLKLDNGFEEDLCNMVVEIKNGIVGVKNILDFGDIDDDIFVLGNIDNNGRILNTNLEDYEIIGNIYENKQLLTTN